MENGCIVIGIGGATCSGKTTIASELHKKLPQSEVIHQDDYYYPVGSPNLEYVEEIKHYNWDSLSAINTDRLVEEIKSKLSNETDCSATSKDNTHVLIIEGTLVLNEPRIHALCTLKYYLTLPYEISKQRRHEKSFLHPDPPSNFDRIVWPHYLKYKSELPDDSNIVFIDSHENDVTTILRIILQGVSKLFQFGRLKK